MAALDELIEYIELHSVEGIRKCFSSGVSPNDHFKGEPLIYELTSEYTRTSRFKECVKAFVDHGLRFDDPALLSVLLDDAEELELQLAKFPELTSKAYSLRCAYTPLYKATLLHVCAEYNHRRCAEVLVKYRADVNARAGVDHNGFGGQTPIFHTVNQNSNNSSEMMDFLLSHSADLKITVPALIWGKGYPWETLVPSVNPISYAMMGLLPQMHREERTISNVVSNLLRHAYGIDYASGNVPNAYLKK